ncbi:hypothetical protein [Janthinobacterium sp. 17J80-10]|uniref:hypothetical protein n=1 Tax=Janthinobacterium sp. 17J80-10 TaxID=2497863 RepID=UPI001005778C|nr:hypothetical protein [Janthinobacterium sp. 17J80-10]QAU33118.1 hypothetical protein EKL02_02400 [Janthinobacterium sp. 17J80-10]
MEFIDQAIAWMRLPENTNLAGWAQAVGATVALVLAIAVPAYQRHAQLLDLRRQRSELNLALATSCRYLLGDVLNFLNGPITLAKLPRSSCRDDVHLNDLLERIHALENREISHARITSLYAARNALILTNMALCSPYAQDNPLSAKELENLKTRITSVNEILETAEYDADFALGEARSFEQSWPARPISRAILWCHNLYKHRHLTWPDRLFGTK